MGTCHSCPTVGVEFDPCNQHRSQCVFQNFQSVTVDKSLWRARVQEGGTDELCGDGADADHAFEVNGQVSIVATPAAR